MRTRRVDSLPTDVGPCLVRFGFAPCESMLDFLLQPEEPILKSHVGVGSVQMVVQ